MGGFCNATWFSHHNCQPNRPTNQPQDKAALMSSLDPSKVAEILALMQASDAVALLASLHDASMTAVSEALSQEERERLMKVRLPVVCL